MTSPDTKADENADAARRALPDTDCFTREMNEHLSTIATFDKLVRRGSLYTFSGNLQTHLGLGGLRGVAFDGEPVHDVRAALIAYADWLRLVAANAL